MNNDRHFILSFDMGGEVFHMSRYCGRLSVWKESIALVSYQMAQEILAPQSFDIWVLMKNDPGDHGTGSWTKHLTIYRTHGRR